MYGKPLPIVDALGAPAASTQTPTHTKSASFEYLTTRKDELVGWARKFSLFPYPFVTACCAMEFMSVSASPYDTDRFGAALPRFSAIWTQVAAAFVDAPDSLYFESFNEPHIVDTPKLNALLSAFYAAVRPQHPTRRLILGWLNYMGPSWSA